MSYLELRVVSVSCANVLGYGSQEAITVTSSDEDVGSLRNEIDQPLLL